MRKVAAILLSAVLFVLCSLYQVEAADKTPELIVKEAKASIKEVSIADVRKMIDAREPVILLDVRDKHEFEEGYIPGAMNISRGSLEFKVALLIPDKSARIIVYCGLDLRGPLATRALNELGYKNAVNMIGGLKAWKEAGYPTGK
jgi:sulfur-carrier protein adenylyltransferase/sulfurtransferase